MAQHDFLASLSRGMHRPCGFRVQHPRLARLISIGVIILFSGVPVIAQTSLHVYGSTASQLSAYSVGADGTLSTLSATPFGNPQFQSGAMAIDGLGKFLFVIDPASSGVWMFSIGSDGTLTVAPSAPYFAAAPGGVGSAPSSPLSLATEHSGQFLFVGYESGSVPGDGAIITFQIEAQDPANPQLVPLLASQSSNVSGLPVTMLAGPAGANLANLYVGVSSSQMGGANAYSIDSSGTLTLLSDGGTANEKERSIAMDPLGRFFFDGWGPNEGFVESAQISRVDGSITSISPPIELGVKNFPQSMLVDSSGRFLYVTVTGDEGTNVYWIDATGNLSLSPVSPLTFFSFQIGTAVADPQGPYIYSLQADGIHGFLVDPVLGDLSPLPIAPFEGTSVGAGGLAISGIQVQAVTGAVVELFPLSQDFGMITLGQASGVKTPSVTNVGSLPVTLSSVTLSGPDMADFTAAPNCSLPTILLSRTTSATCSISVTFVPTGSGPLQATLTTTDSAGTQSVQLTGIGIGAQSAVTLVPGSLSFPSTLQGRAAAAQSVLLTSSGMATLHISSVQLGGSNASDFTMTNGCISGSYPANSACTMSVTFSPLAGGSRTASLLIFDDAPGSPQTVSLTGTGAGAAVANPAAKITPAALSFPATAPGTTSSQQNVTILSSGTSALHFSSAPQLSGPNASDYSVSSNGCSAAGYAVNTACVVGLTFKPSATGTRTASLAISDDAPGSPQTVPLTGISNTLLTVAPGPGGSLSASITAGQTATYDLQLTPGFTGMVSFSCSGAPTAATCAVPAALNVTSGTSAPVVVTVTTTGSSAHGPLVDGVRLIPFSAVRTLLVAMLFCLLVWTGLTLCGTASRAGYRTPNVARSPRIARVAGLVALAALTGCSFGGCGGGSSVARSAPLTQPLVTPSGTSTILVTLAATTSGGTSLAGIAPVQLSLTVN